MELKGFSSWKAVLPGLNLEVALPLNTYFRDDGIVRDLEEHDKKVLSEVGIERLKGVSSSLYGRHRGFKLEKDGEERKYSVVFVKDNGNTRNILAQGHESAHAAMFLQNAMGLEFQIVGDINNYGFRINPFKKYSGVEDICDSVGLFAVYKQMGRPGLTAIHKNPVYFFNDTMQVRPYQELIDDLLRSQK